MDARWVTRMSLMLECLIIVLCGAVASLFIVAGLPCMHHLILAAVIGADAAMRFSSLHEGRIELPGFYEWILPKIWRR